MTQIELELWDFDKATKRVTPNRRAEFWQAGEDGSVDCTLCYRQCHLEEGESGWCNIRRNDGGEMTLTSHGVLSTLALMQQGYQESPFLAYKTGALALFVGGVSCTAGCSFCMSGDATWNPNRLKWGVYGEYGVATGLFSRYRAAVHPMGVVDTAKRYKCSYVVFGINEPTLTWEFTFDVARLAKQAGLGVLIETNGFTEPEAIRRLAPYVDAVDVGVKGSADPLFYEKHMRSPGALSTVFQSILEWKRAGVHLVIGDLIAPVHLQTDESFKESAERLYAWILENVGEDALVITTHMYQPATSVLGASPNDMFVRSDDDVEPYIDRLITAKQMAKDAGLHYAHGGGIIEEFTCKECGEMILRISAPRIHCTPCTIMTHFCQFWTHEQHVTDGKCNHCGAQTPLDLLSEDELAQARRDTFRRASQAKSNRADLSGNPLSNLRYLLAGIDPLSILK